MFDHEKSNEKKALKHQNKGDSLFKKGKYHEALEEYQKSLHWDEEREEIYPKLIETLNQFENEWNEEHFTLSMTWTMKLQEIQNPQIKSVHQRFTPEYQEIQQLLQRLWLTIDEKSETEFTQKILGYLDKANVPLLDFIISLKKLATQGLQNLDETIEENDINPK